MYSAAGGTPGFRKPIFVQLYSCLLYTSGKVPNSGEFTVSETVNVRKSANENSDRIGVCYSGEKLEILMKQADGWTRVKFQGETGYVKSDVLK